MFTDKNTVCSWRKRVIFPLDPRPDSLTFNLKKQIIWDKLLLFGWTLSQTALGQMCPLGVCECVCCPFVWSSRSLPSDRRFCPRRFCCSGVKSHRDTRPAAEVGGFPFNIKAFSCQASGYTQTAIWLNTLFHSLYKNVSLLIWVSDFSGLN